ncbi:MAG: M14 family zinc carboxypeptidase, partial [Thermomicrobiales bacterium]
MTESASQDNSGIDALSPERFFSSGPEADGSLLRWAALRSYFDHLAERTALVRSAEIGFDWSGLPLQLVVISSARNMARLEEIRDIQRRLSDPRGIATVAERDRLIADAPCVVAITCSIHATEVGGSQGAPWFAHDLISTSPELLDDVVILLVPCLNPGGLELVVDWRERWRGKSHEGVPPPELYHPFCGHDNNRDWVMQSQPEIRAVVEHVHRRWSPHIVVDLHELVPNGPRYVVPPYIEPVDPNVPALLEAGAATLGSHIAAALLLAGKTGVVSGALFDAYSPMRAYPFHHGGVRVLAEAAGTRLGSPATISWESLAAAPEFDPHLRGPRHLAPWPGGRWTLRDVIDHQRIAVAAVAEHASRFRARWVRTAWHARAETCARAEPAAYVLLPYIWQRDPGAALELADLLRTGDLEVSASLDAFEVNGVEFPPGSLLLLHGQPNWGYAVTLLGAEDYPMRRRSPSGPVQTPYDVTGHNLPLLMGVDVVA